MSTGKKASSIFNRQNVTRRFDGKKPHWKMTYAEIETEAEELQTLQSENPDAFTPEQMERLQNLAETYEKMNNYLQPFDDDPIDMDNVLYYGSKPVEDLAKIAESSRVVQARFNEQVRIFDAAMSRYGTFVKGVKDTAGVVSSLYQGSKDLMKKSKRFVSAAFNKIRGRETESEEVKIQNQAKDLIDEQFSELKKIESELKGMTEGIEQALELVDKMGRARVLANDEVAIYQNALPELKRRYDEVYIPDAQANYDQNPGPNEREYKAEIENVRAEIEVLEATLASSLTVGENSQVMLASIKESLNTQRSTIRSMVVHMLPQYVTVLNDTAMAGSALKVAARLKEIADGQDKFYAEAADIALAANRLTREANARSGAFSTDVALRVSEALEADQKAATQARVERIENAQNATKAHRAAQERLEGAVEHEKREALEATKRLIEQDKPAAPVNDNKDEATPAEKKAAAKPARRFNNGGSQSSPR